LGGTVGTGDVVPAGGTVVPGSTLLFGMSCTNSADCPSGATCCDGSSENCDGTRVPSGDGTDSGEFVVSLDGLTVTDTITGLAWQRDGSGSRPNCATDPLCTWVEANAYCAGLALDDLSGWRLPAVMELRTIVDFTRTKPLIDPTAFPNMPATNAAESFWTSSTQTVNSFDYAWSIKFIDGFANSSAVGGYASVRCVRGSRCYPTDRFVVVKGGLVQDTLTGLVWRQDGSDTRNGCSGSGNLTCTWAEAQAYCAGLGSGFRLPTLKELLSIVDFTVASGPMINQTAFPNTPFSSATADSFWTSSPYAGLPGYVWNLWFLSGGPGTGQASGYGRVRCVR